MTVMVMRTAPHALGAQERLEQPFVIVEAISDLA
jgi:hypothetical protein